MVKHTPTDGARKRKIRRPAQDLAALLARATMCIFADEQRDWLSGGGVRKLVEEMLRDELHLVEERMRAAYQYTGESNDEPEVRS
jgi:hypothetical protein